MKKNLFLIIFFSLMGLSIQAMEQHCKDMISRDQRDLKEVKDTIISNNGIGIWMFIVYTNGTGLLMKKIGKNEEFVIVGWFDNVTEAKATPEGLLVLHKKAVSLFPYFNNDLPNDFINRDNLNPVITSPVLEAIKDAVRSSQKR